MMIAFALFAVSIPDNQTEASSVRVGTYSDGTPAYLLTETLAGGRTNFSCDVIAGRSRLHYRFYITGGGPYYKNSWSAEDYVYGGESPFAERIWEWVQSH